MQISCECTAGTFCLEKHAGTGASSTHWCSTWKMNEAHWWEFHLSRTRPSISNQSLFIELIKCLCKRRGLKTSLCPRPIYSSELESAPRLVLTAVWEHKSLPFLFLRSICQTCLSFHIKTGLFLGLWCFCCPSEEEMSAKARGPQSFTSFRLLSIQLSNIQSDAG